MASDGGVTNKALATQGNATAQSGQAYGTIAPLLTQEATNPTGYTPQEKANMLTAGEQATGGATSAAVGQGGLLAARTNNIGGATAAVDDAAREGQVQNSVNALGVENQNANLMEKQRQEGISGLNQVYDNSNATGLDALGRATAAQAQKNAWQQDLFSAAGQVGGGWAGGGFKR